MGHYRQATGVVNPTTPVAPAPKDSYGNPVQDSNAKVLPFGLTPDVMKFIRGDKVVTDTSKSPSTQLMAVPMTLSQATDQMIDLSQAIVRGIPTSQGVYAVSDDAQNVVYAADTEVQVNEVIRGEDIGKTLTIRDIQICLDGPAECTKPDRQRVTMGSAESIYFLVPGSEAGKWRLTDHALGHGEFQNGRIKGIERTLDEVRAKKTPEPVLKPEPRTPDTRLAPAPIPPPLAVPGRGRP